MCKDFSNGTKVMLLVLYHVHEDFSNSAKFLFSWYDMAYPNTFYSSAKFEFLWYNVAYPNDSYNGTEFECFMVRYGVPK